MSVQNMSLQFSEGCGHKFSSVSNFKARLTSSTFLWFQLRGQSYTIKADAEINEQKQPRQKVGFQMKFREELELGSCSEKHLNILSLPSVLRAGHNMKQRLKPQVSPGPQHVLKRSPALRAQCGGKSIADSKGCARKASQQNCFQPMNGKMWGLREYECILRSYLGTSGSNSTSTELKIGSWGWVPAGQNVWERGWSREVSMFTRLKYINERLKRKKRVLKSVPEQTRPNGNKTGEIQVLCTWKKVGCNIVHMLKTWKLGRPEKREL